MIEPPRWSADELVAGSEQAKAIFRKERMEEPLEDYLEAFDEWQGVVEELFETTVDLTDMDVSATDIVTDKRLLHVSSGS